MATGINYVFDIAPGDRIDKDFPPENGVNNFGKDSLPPEFDKLSGKGKDSVRGRRLNIKKIIKGE